MSQLPTARHPVACALCDVGRASGVGRGQFCPFIERAREPGQLLYLQGEAASHVWFIKRGTVALLREAGENEGSGRVRAIRVPGTFIGLEALVSPQYTDSARAVTELAICGATREGIDAWLGPRGTPARTALELTLRAHVSDPIHNRGTAIARVATWLRDEIPIGASATLPRKLVADLLGMRAETFSRALTSLANRGAIQVTRSTLSVVDHGLLEDLAAGRELTE